MSLLWTQAVWRGRDPLDTFPVRQAGFAGYVHHMPILDPNLHHLNNDEMQSAMADPSNPEHPDHFDGNLMDFVGHHIDNTRLWKKKGTLGPISLRQPIFATQSHLSQRHLNKYMGNPLAQPRQPAPGQPEYLPSKHPLFVTRNGRMHTVEGHHRVAAALARGDDSIEGWHYDADKHGFPSNDPREKSRWDRFLGR